jgi:hypothetical protein
VAAHYGCTSTGFYDTNAVLGSQKMVVTHFGGDGAGATYGGFGPVGQVSAFGEHLACWNPAACVVSGSYTTGLTGPKFGLLATVSDTGFTPYTVPLPPGVTGAESTTTGVTCTSSAACVATGVYWTSPIHDAGMLVQLSGPNLTSASTGTPGGATSAVLDTIALDTDSTAVAVGGYTAADGSQQGLLLSGLPVPAPPP